MSEKCLKNNQNEENFCGKCLKSPYCRIVDLHDKNIQDGCPCKNCVILPTCGKEINKSIVCTNRYFYFIDNCTSFGKEEIDDIKNDFIKLKGNRK